MNHIGSCLGALALELTPGTAATRTALGQAEAGALAALLARDLGKIVPAAAELDLAVVTALFDPVELLRPAWPLHREMERLIAQAPGAGEPRIIAFAGQAGELPDSLRPQADFAGGALRLLPFVLRGEGALAARVGEQLEHSLLDIGMAGADTALLAQQAFGASIEHARLLTVHDLAAMMAMQYENVGLGAFWPLVETALLAPDQERWLDAPPEPLVRLSQGQARIALFEDQAWAASELAAAFAGQDESGLGRAFDRFQMRQRQIAALLEAHGIAATFDYCPAGQDAREILRA